MATKEQIEGIKLIGDWCKWYAAIDVAAITTLGIITKPDNGLHLPAFVKIFCSLAIFAFFISIVLAAWNLSSLPEAVQDIQEHCDNRENDRIWNRVATLFTRKISFFELANFQLKAFLLGITFFSFTVISIIFLR